MARYSNPQIRQKTFRDSTHNEHRDTLKLVFGPLKSSWFGNPIWYRYVGLR